MVSKHIQKVYIILYFFFLLGMIFMYVMFACYSVSVYDHMSIIYSKYLANIDSIPNIKSYKTWVKSDYILFPLNVWQPHLESLFEQTCRRRQYDINLYFYALSKFDTTKGLSSPITSKLLRGDLLNAHQINNYVLQFQRIICILLSKILTLNWG